MGKILEHLSVSQVQLFDDQTPGGCERKWGFEYLFGFKPPPNKSQVVGTETHAQVEHYLKTGEDVLGRIARAGKRFMPDPKTVLVEHPILPAPGSKTLALTAAGVPFKGFIDALNDTGAWRDDEGVAHAEPGVVELVDWKTSKDVEKWGKTPAQLRDTVQMIGYGEWARRNFAHRGDAACRLSHGTFQTEGTPRARKVSVKVEYGWIRDAWRRIDEDVAPRMVAAAAGAANPSDLAPNPDACQAFGGCPHRARCDLSPVAKLLGSTAHRKVNELVRAVDAQGGSMTVLERIRAQQAERSQAAERAKAAETPAPTPPTPAVPTPGAQGKIDPAKVQAEVARLRAEEAAAVNPPEAPKSAPPTSAKPFTAEEKKDLPSAIAEAAKAWDPPAAPAAPVADAGEPPKTAKAGPGRPRKKPVEAPVAVAAPPAKDGATVPAGIVILADCIVQGIATTPLEAYVAAQCAKLCEAFGADDVRCAPTDGPLGFGKWKGALAALCRDEPPPAGAYTADLRGSEVMQVVVEALRPRCSTFVRGAS